MNTPYDITNKVALVTGANRGIGKAIVDSFIQSGVAKVYAAVRNPESAAPLVAEYGDKVVPLELDLSKPETVTAAAQVASDVEVVVNNAGILMAATPLDTAAFETLSKEIDVNVMGLMRIAQAFAPVLKSNGGGALVQLNSVASLKNFAAFATYSASKAASYSITQGLRELLREQGTAVLSVHPGPIATDMASDAGLEEIAEPASVVSDGIVASLKTGAVHLFPDTMAKQFWGAYQGFAENVVEPEMQEG